MRLHPRTLAPAALLAALAIAPPAQAAEALYGVTDGNTLVTFASSSPGSITSSAPLTGLAPGDQVIALDVRPATGQLYALGATSRIYRINPASGAAAALGNPFTPPLAGSQFGFDFNPAADRIRITSDGRQNLRVNPEDGSVAGDDGMLEYKEGDPGAGSNPSPGGAAYLADATLVAIDSARDVLAVIAPPNAGQMATVGPLGVDLVEPVAFDVAADGRAWAVARRAGSGTPELFLVDAKTGRATPGALLPGVGTAFGAVRGIAAAGPVPDDRQRPSLLVAVDRSQAKRNLRRTLRVQASCSEACSLTAVVRRGKRRVAVGRGGLARAGKLTLQARPSARMRRLARRPGAVRLSLSVRAVDAAGNRTRATRSIRFE